MHKFRSFALVAIAGACFSMAAPAEAQVSIGINLGPPPSCPYGYYDYAPYSCAPYGYYGPEWFNGGVFIGAGKWFHGPANFHGHVNNSFDVQHGYKGPLPSRGEKPDPAKRPDGAANFKGNEVRDGRGNAEGDRH